MKSTDVIDCTFQGRGQNIRAADLERPINTIRERLTGLLADCGGDVSTLLTELDAKRVNLQKLEADATSRSHEAKAVRTRVEIQEKLIDTLEIKAEKAVTLRKVIHDKDLELEKKNSEIHGQHELISALQRDAKGIGRLKGTISTKDKEFARLVKEKQHAQQHAVKLTEKFKILNAELQAVRAELESHESLRGDIGSQSADVQVLATYAEALEAQLEEKRDVISKFEAFINLHLSTQGEPLRSGTTWKKEDASLINHSATL